MLYAQALWALTGSIETVSSYLKNYWKIFVRCFIIWFICVTHTNIYYIVYIYIYIYIYTYVYKIKGLIFEKCKDFTHWWKLRLQNFIGVHLQNLVLNTDQRFKVKSVITLIWKLKAWAYMKLCKLYIWSFIDKHNMEQLNKL